MFEIEFRETGEIKALPLALDMSGFLHPLPVGPPRVLSLCNNSSYIERNVAVRMIKENAPKNAEGFSLGGMWSHEFGPYNEFTLPDYRHQAIVQYYRFV